jgi:GAF domain-containing protein
MMKETLSPNDEINPDEITPVDEGQSLDSGELGRRPRTSVGSGRSSEQAKIVAEETAALERFNGELAALNTVATAISQSLDLPQVLEAAIEQALALFDVEVAVILMVDERAGRLRLKASRGAPSRVVRNLDGLKLEESLCGQVVLSSQPLVVRDVAHDQRALAETQQTDLNLLALVPLKVRDRVLGVLGVASRQPRAFTEEDESLLEAIGRQVGIAVENARLHEETQRRLEEMVALHETSLDITSEMELQEVLQAIVDRASKLLRAKGGGIYLYDPNRDELVLAVSTVPCKGYTGMTLKLGEGLGGKVALTGEPMVVDNYSKWEGRSPKYECEPFTAIVAAPMKWRGRIIGTINIVEDAAERTFTQEDVTLLSAFADQAAIAIANVRLYEETRRSAADLQAANDKLERINRQLLALYQTSAAIGSALNLDAVQQRIADEVVKNLDFDVALITTVDVKERALGHLAFAGLEPSLLHQIEKLAGESLSLSIPLDSNDNLGIKSGRTGQIEITHDLHELLRPGISQAVATGIQELIGVQTIAVVPLILKASLTGVLAAMTLQSEISEDTLTALSIFASQAAITIANARLFEDVLHMAEQIEQQNKELLETRDRLVKAERLAAIGQIGLTIRHEINNPLTGILGLTQWLLGQESDLPESVRNDLRMIEDMAIRIRDIVAKLETVEDRTKIYLGDTRMIDLH